MQTLYEDYSEYLIDMKVLGTTISEPVISWAELRGIYYKEFAERKPKPTLEAKRYEKSRHTSEDYKIEYTKQLELKANEKLVNLQAEEGKKQLIGVSDVEVIDSSVCEVFAYENGINDAFRAEIMAKYDLTTGDEFESDIEEVEQAQGTTKYDKSLELSEEEIENMSSEEEIEDDEDFEEYEEYEDSNEDEYDEDSDEDEYDEYDEEEYEEDSEDDIDDEEFEEYDEDSDEEDDYEDSEDDYDEDEDDYEESEDEYDEEDYDEEEADEYDNDEDEEELQENAEEGKQNTKREDEAKRELGSQYNNVSNTGSNNSIDTNINGGGDSNRTSEAYFNPLAEDEKIETNNLGYPAQARAEPEPYVLKPDAHKPIEKPVEPEPTDLRQFIRKHPRCEYNFALQYFTKKQINDAIKVGKVVKRGNILKL